MRCAFVAAEQAHFAVRQLCRLVGLAASTFYDWLRRDPDAGDRDDAVLLARIREIFKTSGQTYGSPRIHAELRVNGWRVSRKRVERLMRENGIAVPKRRKRQPMTTDSRHALPIAPNLLDREFDQKIPDTVWLADITYIATDEGWLYLAAIKDMATREIVGWAMNDHLRSELCERALIMAIQRRQPPRGLICHSDRGVQYARGPYRKILDRHGFKQSLLSDCQQSLARQRMSRKGSCLDNAPMESFFGALKTELVHRCRFATRDDARRTVFRWIETYYNRRRRHSSIGYLTPVQAFTQMAQAA